MRGRVRRSVTEPKPRSAHLMTDERGRKLVRGRQLTGRAQRFVPEDEAKRFARRVAERLCEVREEQEVSRAELAAALGIGESQVWRLERGQSKPKLGMLYRWATALGIRPTDLLEVDA